jgi:hypothetical protein
MRTPPPHEGRGTGRAPALSAKSRGARRRPRDAREDPGNLKATPRRRERGLGSAGCRALSLNGVKVAVNGQDRAAIESVVGQLHGAGAEAMAAAADCADAAALAAHAQPRLSTVRTG